VIATDQAANAEANLRKYIDTAWPSLTALGLDEDASQVRLSFTPDLKKALGNADFVQGISVAMGADAAEMARIHYRLGVGKPRMRR
jgi:hypothetical protein